MARKRRRTHADFVTGSHRTLESEIFIDRERRERAVLVKEKSLNRDVKGSDVMERIQKSEQLVIFVSLVIGKG